jgi:hypothetical protein
LFFFSSLLHFFAGVPFQRMFTSRGYNIDVDNTAIGGTTAKYWARNPVRRDKLEQVPRRNPDCARAQHHHIELAARPC